MQIIKYNEKKITAAVKTAAPETVAENRVFQWKEIKVKYADFRRDTITLPTLKMKERAFEAELGDSVYGEDPNQDLLEKRAAELMRKEAALFVPSGTMGNLAALLSHTGRGDEVIIEENAHIRTSETGGAACLGGLMLRTVPGPLGAPQPPDIEMVVRAENIHYPRTTLICIESSHYRYGGRVAPLDLLYGIRETAGRRGLPIHLDGARIFNAAGYLGCTAADIAGCADTVMFCLSKGLGAPVGSMLCGPQRFIENARRYRKMLGGGMRQTGWLCSCGLTALEDENIDRLRCDNENARYIADGLAEIDGLEIDPDAVHTNFAVVRITGGGMNASGAAAALAERGFLLSASGADVLRLVTCSRVDRSDCEALVDACKELFG